MTLFEQWEDLAYDTKTRTREQIDAFWKDYFEKEKNIYDSLLNNPEEEVKGTVPQLAEKYNVSEVEMTGFLDGINDSLVEQNPLKTMDENTVVSLNFDNERLYRNMIDADAEWLYGLPQWDDILGADNKKAIFLDQKKSHTVHVLKIGRNEPCPCGSGKKYKFCHGKKGAEPLSEDVIERWKGEHNG